MKLQTTWNCSVSVQLATTSDESTYEDEVVLVSNVGDSNGSNLADQGVESKADHGGDTDTLGSSPGVEDLCGYDPYMMLVRVISGGSTGSKLT